MVETCYIQFEFAGKGGGWSINLPFVCTKCGVCCLLDDFLTAGEIKATSQEQPKIQRKLKTLYDELAVLLQEGEEKYDDYVMHTPCPFLKDKICSIYSIRPDGCRQFPNTRFAMLSTDCEALIRFKKQIAVLSRGRKTKKTFYFTTDLIRPAKLTRKQYQNCVAKLEKASITTEELDLLKTLNKESNLE